MADKIISNNLSTLFNKYKKDNVILEMEKQFKSNESQLIDINLIKENNLLKDVKYNNEDLTNIGNSLLKIGFTSPIIVRKKDSIYELVLGRKNFLAAKKIVIKQSMKV